MMTSNNGTCYQCGAYVPEGRQTCSACEREANADINAKAPDGVMRKLRPAIIRAAKARPAKYIDMHAVYEIGRIGLAFILTEMADNPDANAGMRQRIIRAIAETRVLVECLAIVHCSSAQDADAYRFYLEQAAKRNDPASPANKNGWQ